jgi:predicted nucleotidyltransferase
MHPLTESHRAQLRNLADRYGSRSLSVDIVTLNALHPLIRKRVLAEAIKL